MTYGDGNTQFRPLVELDVAGHEMSHGLTSATANLDYVGDSGGLNESTSDVMGTMVEFGANNSKDPGDYVLGEKIVKGGGVLRRMDNPFSDGHSPNCWSSSLGSRDPHYSSGVGNHLFYLLSEGTGTKTIGGGAQLLLVQLDHGDAHRTHQRGRDLVPRSHHLLDVNDDYHRASNGMVRGCP